jgi:hypothetical protein
VRNRHEFDNSSTRIFLLSNGTQLWMSCPYTSPQNGKAERIIRSINNVIRTFLIQASLHGRYWVERLHIATYLPNHLPTKAVQVACPHIALFGSVPSYEHLQIFGCACYPNTAATAPHKLAPRSTRCIFLYYSSDHKRYRCLDLSTNRLIVSRHVVFYDDNFPLAALPNPTNIDFLCESGFTVSTVGTRLTATGTVAPYQPAPEVPPSFEPLVAPLPALAVPPGFLPREAPTAAPRTVPASSAAPTAVPDGPPPHEWPVSPIAYIRHPRQPAPRGYHSTSPSSVTSCGRSGRGGAYHASGEFSPDGHTGEGWLPSAT